MNKKTVTIQDCIEMFQRNETRVILNDGKVKGFVQFRKRKNPHTDR